MAEIKNYYKELWGSRWIEATTNETHVVFKLSNPCIHAFKMRIQGIQTVTYERSKAT